jgi:outer membrane cobalamin receptor
VAGFAEHLRARPSACLTLIFFVLTSAALADTWRGQELQTVIEALRDAGLPVVYSSGLIQPGMPVVNEPGAPTAVERLGEALRPYGLAVRAGPYGSVLIVRGTLPAASDPEVAARQPRQAAVPELIVTTSRYEMQRDPVLPVAMLANTDVERLPDLGDDPLRAIGRLPGTAINGLSSKTNIRGGATDETLVTFDDLRLFNPFHLKDFQSIFSSIDPAVIEGLDVYTGAFPTPYGDRLSGVIGIRAFEPPGDAYRALTLTLFNAAALVSGGWNDGQGTWLISARRGNLDLLLDITNQNLGKPRYSDLHGQVSWEFSEAFSLSANALIFDDNIKVFDSDRTEEEASATYHDSYLWLRADVRPDDDVTGYALLSYADLRVRRDGTASQPGTSAGILEDRRSAGILGLATQWSVDLDGGHRVDVGGEFRRATGRYYYADEVTFDLLFDTPGAPTERERSRNVAVSPDGEYYAAYLNGRFDLPGNWTTELGLRWDRSTLVSGSGHLGPRASLLYQLTASTLLRASWGRYWQSQGIDELAVSDGETTFAETERADQLVIGIEQQLGADTTLRLEAYTKDYYNPRDRYENLLNTFVLLPELKPDRVRVAADRATARGMELSLHSSDDGPLDWWGSYSWSEARDEINGVKFQRSWDQSHALGAGVLYSSTHWDLSAAAIYRTGWPTTLAVIEDDGPQDIVTTGPRNAERLGYYATLDLRAARRFQTEVGMISVFLEVSNALNRRNDCCVEYGFDSEDGFEYERHRNLPIIPSVGISWQF